MADLVRINTNISKDANDWLASRSERTGMSKSALIHMSIEHYRNQVELIDQMPKISQFMQTIGEMDMEDFLKLINSKGEKQLTD